MNTFELAGQAMLQAHAGNLQIASAARDGLRSIFRRIGELLALALNLNSGPDRLP